MGDRPAYLPLLALSEWLPTDVKVRIVPVPDVSQRWAMLADGRLDMACGTMDSFALASLHQQIGHYLFSIGAGAGEDVVMAQTGTSHLADLSGKSIAVPRGGRAEYLLGLMFSNDGLSLSQSHLVYTATASRRGHPVAKEFRAGRAAVGACSQPGSRPGGRRHGGQFGGRQARRTQTRCVPSARPP